MTGKWLGQQPLRQESHRQKPMRRTATSSAAVLVCMMLACSGCVDIAARTAGIPITGKRPPDKAGRPDKDVAVAGEVTLGGNTSNTATPSDGKATDGSAADSLVADSGVAGRPSFDSPSPASPSSTAVGSGASPAAGSADGFPDAGEVGLTTDSVAD